MVANVETQAKAYAYHKIKNAMRFAADPGTIER